MTVGCEASKDVEDVEDALVEQFLDPLATDGITLSVESACRYAGPVDAPWHLSMELRIDARRERVVDALKGEGMIVRSDREPMLLQQIPGKPDEGWNGSLVASGDDSILYLLYNNATHDWPDALGWADVCPGSPGSATTSPAPATQN
jgi:hypothetical protein